MSNTYKTKEDVLRRAQEAVGKTLAKSIRQVGYPQEKVLPATLSKRVGSDIVRTVTPRGF